MKDITMERLQKFIDLFLFKIVSSELMLYGKNERFFFDAKTVICSRSIVSFH